MGSFVQHVAGNQLYSVQVQLYVPSCELSNRSRRVFLEGIKVPTNKLIAERAKVGEMVCGKRGSVGETSEESASTGPRFSFFTRLKNYNGHTKEEEESSSKKQKESAYVKRWTDGDSPDAEPGLISIKDIELEECEKEGGGSGCHSSSSRPGNNSESIKVSIDPDVLDCSDCRALLRAPLFECDNGHVVCFLCRAVNKCHVCSLPIGSRRCLALETVIEAMKIPCPNSTYGCRETIPYIQKDTHKESCPFGPCSCPISSCTFRGYTEHLPRHIQNEHHSTTPLISFSYNRFFKVALQQKEPFFVLHGKDDRIFLLLNECNTVRGGNSLSVVCMRQGSVESDLRYKIKVKGKGCQLHLEASPKNIREFKVGSPAGRFLFVPHEISDSAGVISIDVQISKMY